MKKILIVLCVMVAIAIPVTAFAATSDTPVAQVIRGFCGIDTSTLTEQQKDDLNDQFQEMIELRKETINKMVTNGTITNEQGDAAIKQIDDMATYRQDNGFTGGRMGRFGSMNGSCGQGHCTFDNSTSN